jgi:hypothetical protein
MVSKTLASLDAWLELAEKVLAEQEAHSEVRARDHGGEPVDPDPEGAGRV